MRGQRHALLLAFVAATPSRASRPLLGEHPALLALGLLLPAVVLIHGQAGPIPRAAAVTRP